MGKDNDRFNKLKVILIERKRKMWVDLRDEIFRKLGKDYNAQFDTPQDIEDLSVLDHVEDLGLTVSDIRRQELEMLDAALRKVEEGTYGKCDSCGVLIEEERLKLMPYTGYCVRCQAEMESGGGKKPTM
ncbi:MAG: hypothetical protein A2V21_301930 [Deltaproteobacteria bacterium GWC2_55_46]|nr:MAG: hypothetical protein A2Z79_06735 [Deltaproteobacteria bacterium GWA2_55_82]OGQ63293.1 MAG: hypothetical protein A3I81_00865 [Deltaproteobacteria bacterium RIFCSPLOWO2_02_FULL_55_12]OIJ73129.1 MAG: hypothetical protein A2V21_301930 [Deltaproteobacteria bacterium GWC2_55_46]